MRHKFADRRPIAYYDALESPLLPQNLTQGERIRRRRHAVQRVEGAHHGRGTGIDRRPKWRQVVLTQRVLGNLGAVVIPPTLGRTVTHIMLGARRHRIRRIETRPLVPADVRSRHHRPQVRIFPSAFLDATPAGIARDIHHR